uniref:Fam-c protein n=1 Tax=Strongyloides stercoralis TaxID=6248 RepID=A0A0K0E1Z0_STRER
MKIYFFTLLTICIFTSNIVKCYNILDNYFLHSSDDDYAGNKIRKSYPFINYEESPIHPFIRFKKYINKDSIARMWSESYLEPSIYNKRFFSRHQMAFRSPASYNYKKNNDNKE